MRKLISTLAIISVAIIVYAEIHYRVAISEASHGQTDGEIASIMHAWGFETAEGTPVDGFNIFHKLKAIVK